MQGNFSSEIGNIIARDANVRFHFLNVDWNAYLGKGEQDLTDKEEQGAMFVFVKEVGRIQGLQDEVNACLAVSKNCVASGCHRRGLTCIGEVGGDGGM